MGGEHDAHAIPGFGSFASDEITQGIHLDFIRQRFDLIEDDSPYRSFIAGG
jgi:hypothetical protein